MREIIFWLIVIHCLADFPLQNDFLARAKSHKKPIEGTPWMIALVAHGAIQAGGVALILPLTYAYCEFVAHALIDYLKTDGKLGVGQRSFAIDQALHILCKVTYALIYTSSL